MALALIIVFACRLSRATLLLGTLVNNPRTVVFIYPLSLALGNLLLSAGNEPLPELGGGQAASIDFWRESVRHLAGWFPTQPRSGWDIRHGGVADQARVRSSG